MCITVWVGCFSEVGWFGLLFVWCGYCAFKVNFNLRGGCFTVGCYKWIVGICGFGWRGWSCVFRLVWLVGLGYCLLFVLIVF